MLPGFNGHLISEYFLESDASGLIDVDVAPGRNLLQRWQRRCARLGPASAVRTLFEAAAVPLTEALGFEPPTGIEMGEFAIAATIRAPDGSPPVALLATSWDQRLDPLWRTAVSQGVKRSAPWALLFNGTHVRVVDVGRPYSRRYVEFDLELALGHERTLAALWSVLRVPAFSSSGAGHRTRLHAMVAASEQLAVGVSRSLREGVLSASANILAALLRTNRTRPTTAVPDALEQSLTIVYRILFLLFAEARGLVPLWHPVYRESYSIESLRSAAERPGRAAGLWAALRAIARLAHAGCRAGDLSVTPFNGRLFAPARTPLAERRGLDDEAARRAVLAVSTRPSPDQAGRERIAYRDLGVEQLGAVYETLLDYEPRIESTEQPGKRRGSPSVALVRGSGARKATGSFYTPQPIADYLIRRTLGILVSDTTPERILQLRVVDPAMGSGAFLVAACRYLADAYEAALVRSGGCRGGALGEDERVRVKRLIAERCLYGVDVNPMAVQLARLSLWLATLSADRPLTFLDHHLQSGDSLTGAWLANLRHPPRPRRVRRTDDTDALPLFDDHQLSEGVRAALPVRFRLAEMPDDTLDDVRAKERALDVLNRRDAMLWRWKRLADLWCAPWFTAPERSIPAVAFTSLADVVLGGTGTLPSNLAGQYMRDAESIAAAQRFFHWELEFPEAFFGSDGVRRSDGGFDAVVGNPPWDMIRADTGPTDRRARSRDEAGRLLRFSRDAGVYIAQSDGHANRYQLFLERSIALAKPGGRIGLVLPSGIAIDHGSARLRRHLFAQCNVDALVGFENQRGVFPIHRSVRFLLLTASRGSPTRSIGCRFGERDPGTLEGAGDEPPDTSKWFPVHLTPAFLERVAGRGLAVPDLRSPVDVTIVERAATLFRGAGDPGGWGLRFGRELNASDDRGCFRPPGGGLPVVEGKHIEPFRIAVGSARFSIRARDAQQLLDPRRYERPRLAYRDVASATNRVTLIAAILPAGCVSTHTVLCLRTPLPIRVQHFLCGVFNSFVANYLVRLRVATHVTTAIVEGLPVPTEHDAPQAFREISVLARALGNAWDRHAASRLQALVARLYQLTVGEFEHVLSTFPLVPADERAAAMEAFGTETQR